MANRPARIRVVVTGVGVANPLGNTLEESWKNALAGRSGIANITRFNTEAYDVKFAGEVKNLNLDDYIPKRAKKMDTFIHYSLAAAKMAMDHENLSCLRKWGAGWLYHWGWHGRSSFHRRTV